MYKTKYLSNISANKIKDKIDVVSLLRKAKLDSKKEKKKKLLTIAIAISSLTAVGFILFQ